MAPLTLSDDGALYLGTERVATLLPSLSLATLWSLRECLEVADPGAWSDLEWQLEDARRTNTEDAETASHDLATLEREHRAEVDALKQRITLLELQKCIPAND